MQYIKSLKPELHVVAIEPVESAVISGNPPGPHPIQGIGAGFIPAIFRKDVVDEVFQVSGANAMATSRRLAREDGLLVGISSGASAYAAIQVRSIYYLKDDRHFLI
jgi:cysteine synthase A